MILICWTRTQTNFLRAVGKWIGKITYVNAILELEYSKFYRETDIIRYKGWEKTV